MGKAKAKMGRKAKFTPLAVKATVTLDIAKHSVSGYEFEDWRQEFIDEQGREPTLREGLEFDLRAEQPSIASVVIERAGNFTPTPCSSGSGEIAEYMVDNRPVSKRVMLDTINKGQMPQVRPLVDDEKGTWAAVDLEQSFDAYMAPPPDDDDED